MNDCNPAGRTWQLHYPGASEMTREELIEEKRWILRHRYPMDARDAADVAMLNAWIRRRVEGGER